jgi:hypothetical protein
MPDAVEMLQLRLGEPIERELLAQLIALSSSPSRMMEERQSTTVPNTSNVNALTGIVLLFSLIS